MIKVAVTGAAGRMGKILIEALSQATNAELAVAIEHPSSSLIGADAGEVAGIGKNGITIGSDLSAAVNDFDVLIDFTAPVATIANAQLCASQQKGLVIGTTGFDEQQKAILLDALKPTRAVMAANYSVCLLYTSPSPRDQRGSRMPSSA